MNRTMSPSLTSGSYLTTAVGLDQDDLESSYMDDPATAAGIILGSPTVSPRQRLLTTLGTTPTGPTASLSRRRLLCRRRSWLS